MDSDVEKNVSKTGDFPNNTAEWTLPRLASIAFFVWFLAGVVPVIAISRLQDSGLFGDSFGMANSLFSALGVAGVAYALILQIEEQRDSRREAAEARQTERERVAFDRERDAVSREHEAVLAMTSSLISAHTAMMNYQMENYRHTNDKLLNHQDKIDVKAMGKVLNEQAQKLMLSFSAIKRLADNAEEKLGIKISEQEDQLDQGSHSSSIR